jgi:hypothetical protein
VKKRDDRKSINFMISWESFLHHHWSILIAMVPNPLISKMIPLLGTIRYFKLL